MTSYLPNARSMGSCATSPFSKPMRRVA
jgi:hypothetical protein